MQILITGANGFIGQWLCAHLHRQGHTLVGFDVQERPEAEVDGWVQGDVRKLDDLLSAAVDCKAVIHLAVLPQYLSQQHPDEDLLVNTLGTLQALRAAVAQGVQRFVLPSSSAVYGATGGCLSEDAPLQPLSPYGVSKIAAEAYVSLFQRTAGLHTVVLRLFNIYGRHAGGAPRPTVESRFLRAALQGERLVIMGDPQRAYDFVHISDVVQALTLALEADVPPGSVFNIGSGEATTLQQLAEMCLRLAGRPHEQPLVRPATASTPPSHWADLQHSRQVLGYQPRQQLAAWLRRSLQQDTTPPFAESASSQ